MKPYKPFAIVPTVLCLIFITLKLTGHINWSWLWVVSPMWIQFLLVGVVASLLIKWINYLERPRTPEEKLAAKFRAVAAEIRRGNLR